MFYYNYYYYKIFYYYNEKNVGLSQTIKFLVSGQFVASLRTMSWFIVYSIVFEQSRSIYLDELLISLASSFKSTINKYSVVSNCKYVRQVEYFRMFSKF